MSCWPYCPGSHNLKSTGSFPVSPPLSLLPSLPRSNRFLPLHHHHPVSVEWTVTSVSKHTSEVKTHVSFLTLSMPQAQIPDWKDASHLHQHLRDTSSFRAGCFKWLAEFTGFIGDTSSMLGCLSWHIIYIKTLEILLLAEINLPDHRTCFKEKHTPLCYFF